MIDKTKILLFSVPINLIGIDDCLKIIENYSEKTFQYIVTPNVDHIIRISKDEKLRTVYDLALLSLCDSRIVKLLAKLCFVNIPNVIPGSDLTKMIFEKVIKSEERVTVIGSNTQSIERLEEIYNLSKINHYSPPMRFIDSENEIASCIEYVKNHPSRYIFFAVGSPQQEILAYKINQQGHSVGLGFCIGASIDFLAGAEKRAPIFIQKLALEWLYRLIQNPRRLWKRYLVDDMKIIPIFFKCLWRKMGG